MGVIREADLRREERVVDADRVDWYRSSFKNIKWVLDAGMPLIGVSFWSCIDNLEVSTGTRFVAFGTAAFLRRAFTVGRWLWHQIWANRYETGLQPDAVAEDVRKLREGGDGRPVGLGLPVLPARWDLNKAWQ